MGLQPVRQLVCGLGGRRAVAIAPRFVVEPEHNYQQVEREAGGETDRDWYGWEIHLFLCLHCPGKCQVCDDVTMCVASCFMLTGGVDVHHHHHGPSTNEVDSSSTRLDSWRGQFERVLGILCFFPLSFGR